MIDDQLRKQPEIGSTIKFLRERVGLSRKQLAGLVKQQKKEEFTVDWLARLETRKQSYPSLKDLHIILEVTGSDEKELRQILHCPELEATWSSPIMKYDYQDNLQDDLISNFQCLNYSNQRKTLAQARSLANLQNFSSKQEYN